jgi:holo-[acyl-carrier protein] synthase
MIIGTGTDITETKRIEASCHRLGVRFLNRIYTLAEQEAAAERGRHRMDFLATRFAAKEAVWKAINADRQAIIALNDIEILPDQAGAPTVTLHGSALAAANAKTDKNWQIDISISDAAGLALAFVVFSAP